MNQQSDPHGPDPHGPDPHGPDPHGPDPYDPFAADRRANGVVDAAIGDVEFTMVLRHGDLRAVCRDPATFTSDTPFRVPIPPEHDIRPTAQLPIESDPPLHGLYRSLMDDHFSRRAVAGHEDAIRATAAARLAAVRESGELEVVSRFALPLFLNALAHVLGRPLEEVDRWLTWGVQALASAGPADGPGGGPGGSPAANGDRNRDLDAYIDDAVDAAMAEPGGDFFGHLAAATIDGRHLTRDEIRGFANLAFAGGRQTVVFAIGNIVHDLAVDPDHLRFLAGDRSRIPTAIEEYLRFMTPIAHLGRTTTRPVTVCGRDLPPGHLVSICYASANRDEGQFENAGSLQLDRRPNRHVAFGHGAHTCVGAPMARLVLRVAVEELLAVGADGFELIEATPHRDDIGYASPQQGYDLLRVRFVR